MRAKQDPGATGILVEAIHPDTRTQYGALCWRRLQDRTEVLLITSRDTGRWIIPKGWPMKNRAPQEAALQEAFEEAGVEGKVSANCLGLYSYFKARGGEDGLPCIVAVYPVKTKRLLDKFPEEGQRKRKWFSPKKAAQKVREPELRELLLSFNPAALKPAPETPQITTAKPVPRRPGEDEQAVAHGTPDPDHMRAGKRSRSGGARAGKS